MCGTTDSGESFPVLGHRLSKLLPHGLMRATGLLLKGDTVRAGLP